MQLASPFAGVPAALADALTSQGFQELTAVQRAVLDPALAGRDLRISSQTGSGKTVALGLALADLLTEPREPERRHRIARPDVLIVAPTRELAAQVGRELTWLFRPLDANVEVVTGGTPMAVDRHALAAGPRVLVGTPGRLVDHLRRRALSLDALSAVVLDEADEMLDLGFREDLETLLTAMPASRRTHLVSATFSPAILQLADSYQRDAAEVHGTRPGAANDDIEHIGILVRPSDRLAALINLLLTAPDEQTLVFARTRAGAAELAAELAGDGFATASLSGDLGQRERTATLEAFRRGRIRVLIATDVAARGLDLRDVGRVVHFDLSDTAEGFTHRSGRTGRAGNKGESITFAAPLAKRRAERLAREAGVRLTWRPVPAAEAVRRGADARLIEALAEAPADADPRRRALADALLARCPDPAALIAALLARAPHTGPCEPRELTPPPATNERRHREARPGDAGRGPRPHPRASGQGAARREFTSFRVTWGASQGADPRRLLALVCRRGGVRGADVGAIRVGPHRSIVDVATPVAEAFARAARRPDPRNPAVTIRPLDVADDADEPRRRHG